MKPHVFGSSGTGRPVNLGVIGKQPSVCCEKFGGKLAGI